MNVAAFDFRNEEIVTIDQPLPTIDMKGELFACGDTGGMTPDPVASRVVRSLGANLPEVVRLLSDAFISSRPSGAAYLRRPSEIAGFGGSKAAFGLLGFLRQTIRLEFGRPSENAISLHLFAVPPEGEAYPLSGSDRARMVRVCVTAVRSREPSHPELANRLMSLEPLLIEDLRKPTSEEIEARLRHAVWPTAAIIFTP